ncbi:hypothetical protein CYPRO_2447 [Cyclonatronum proteinivorum]|uniref:Polysaccharide (De)acetylase n=1 Tax=Cyclonatronum proteinivorum TaxID=1457365 RepID=A0A345UMI7_9BACT|nr:polysaccharide (de)acetylase [Cyclonatronum proteinivorum]AXJ01689.1 hypothetical protein CYPRO_2447 [Cyclonatronum proteinivorum]
MKLLKYAIRTISNIPGYSTRKKIVVIESDDWGSIRMPSLQSLDKLEQKGLNLRAGDSSRYNLNDTLADSNDLTGLFEVLHSYKDHNGNPACFTAMSLPANPDFDKIRDADFQNYHYEAFTKTLERYGRTGAFDLWKKGREENVFVPEYHGREHLNVVAWMRSLKRGDNETRLAFDEGLWAFSSSKTGGVNFQAPYDVEYPEDISEQVKIIKDGLSLFEQVHGYKARFFVPPNGKINSAVEEGTHEGGIKYISTPKIHHEVLGNKKTKKHFRYIGKKNKLGQTYLTRNAFFEPNQGMNKDHVDSCLKEIEMAFKYNKPAIISSHRCNYIGSLNTKNRSHGLNELGRLLRAVLKKWPETEFMSSSHLGRIIHT